MEKITFINKYLSHYLDFLGAILFALLSYYFYNIPERSSLEEFLLIGSVGGLVMDSLFCYSFLVSQT